MNATMHLSYVISCFIIAFVASKEVRQSHIETATAATNYNHIVTEAQTYNGFDDISTIKSTQLDMHEAVIRNLSEPSDAIQFNWNITISDVTMEASNSNNDSFAMINLRFNVSHSRMPKVKVNFYDSICSQGSVSTYLHEMSKEYNANNWGIIQIGVNKKDMQDSKDYFNGTLNFCVRINANGQKYMKPISYDERIITMNFDMANSMAPTEVSYRKVDPSVVTFENSFKVDACVCDVLGNSTTCLAKPMIQNQQFDLCIFSLSDMAMIDSVNKLQMLQENVVKYKPIVDGLDDPLTKSITRRRWLKTNDGHKYNGARITARVISSFFMNRPLHPVIIRGEVLLTLTSAHDNDRRSLYSGDHETELQSFAIMFQPGDNVVSKVTRNINDARTPKADSSDRKIDNFGISGIVFGISISVFIVAAVMIYVERYRSRITTSL